MQLRKFVSRSSQPPESQADIKKNLQTVAMYTDSNILMKNRYAKIKRTVNQQQKANHFIINKVSFKPKSQSALYQKPNNSEEFISNFIRSQKIKFINKFKNRVELNDQVFMHVKTRMRPGDFNGLLPNRNSQVLYEYKMRGKELRQSCTDKNIAISSQSPDAIIKTAGGVHSRQVSQPNASPKKNDTSPQKIHLISEKPGNFQFSIRKANKQTNVKTVRQTFENLQQLQEANRKNKSILLHDGKQLSNIKSQSYAVIQYPSGQLILNYRSKQSLQIASLTKIMTCYLIIKLCQKHNRDLTADTFQVKQYVQYSTGTTAQLIHGDCYTIEQLLYALMLPSGNDAALCLADWAGGMVKQFDDHKQNIKNFVKMMNTKAKQLGLQDTRYGNPHGLPHPDTKSTAYDMCKLCFICMDIPLFRKIISARQYKTTIKTSDGQKRQVLWQNTNKLLRRPGFLGIKTGITITAGPCLASAYQFRDKTYIAVLLRASKVSRRFTQTRKILYWTICNLNKHTLTNEQMRILQDLRKNKRDLDSDNSQDEQQFKYTKQTSSQYAKRKKILKYQL